eukprot:EG_transcript_2907
MAAPFLNAMYPDTTLFDLPDKDRMMLTMATKAAKTDNMLWIPAASVGAFIAVLLLPGLLRFLCPPGVNSKVNAFLTWRPLNPRQARWWDAWTLDLIPALRDMHVADFLICSCWLVATMCMTLSPQGDKDGRVLAVAWATLLLPITKHSIWAVILGATFERYLKFHRWAARAATVIAVGHCIQQAKKRGLTVAFTHWQQGAIMYGNLWGQCSFALMVILCLLSIEPIRRNRFELFYYSHFLALLAVVFAMMHSYAMCYAVIPALALYLIDKFVQLWCFAHTYRILEATPVAGGARLVLHRKGAKISCEPGQYYLLTLPAVSWLQKHPFTAALLASKADTLTFLIRDQGPGSLTHKVCTKNFSETATARLMGPYGSLSLPRPLHKYHAVYLVAGGVGVTPMISTAQYLMQLERPRPKVHFVWLNRNANAFLEWFPTVLLDMASCDDFELMLYHTHSSRATVTPSAAISTTVSAVGPAPTPNRVDPFDNSVELDMVDSDLKDEPTASSSDPSNDTKAAGKLSELSSAIISGRPDLTAVFAPDAGAGSDVAVLVCGPASLVMGVQRIAQQSHFHFHKEAFLF